MPYHFMTARTDPARSVLFAVASLTAAAQTLALVLSWPWGIINFVPVLCICAWAIWSTFETNMKHMGWSSFWLGMLWTWTGLTRLIVVEGIGELLWVPFLIVGVVMGICYLYFSYHRKRVGELG